MLIYNNATIIPKPNPNLMTKKASYISLIVFYSAICEQENIQLSIGE